MKVFVAGSSGAIGRRLIPLLVRTGHSVIAMTRPAAKTDVIRSAGAVPAVADALDKGAVMAVVQSAEPEVVVHQLTAIPPRFSIRRFDREFALTNRLRTEGTDLSFAKSAADSQGDSPCSDDGHHARRMVARTFDAGGR